MLNTPGAFPAPGAYTGGGVGYSGLSAGPFSSSPPPPRHRLRRRNRRPRPRHPLLVTLNSTNMANANHTTTNNNATTTTTRTNSSSKVGLGFLVAVACPPRAMGRLLGLRWQLVWLEALGVKTEAGDWDLLLTEAKARRGTV